ncbi:DUF488 family protein [Archangium sp.]|uniref:DUF488 domain-containing protein n=1 Tax=Archangium sp. TaxID=1872627 RepID=UPI00389AE47E
MSPSGPHTKNLYTFGYEGLDIGDFTARMRKMGVQLVVDVRQLPLSRKRGFSKNSLSDALASSSLEYIHMPALGCPKPIRERYKVDADWAAYVKAFNAYLSTQTEAIAELVGTARTKTACLICFESDFNFCHRSLVASAASSRAGDLAPVHLS